ncbi:hypothetical protein WR25_12509 [Diploscapter pachys]|uniref:UBX domain-containing protein n=1 Tax=Diploscapter pachys TaxID=2018661 RepID=A0A2A2JEA7_9BILA|nr:hypothetical protein WR25_12509 [Diploscapter pachys]
MSSVSPVAGEVVLSGEQEDLDSVREQTLLSPSATAFTDPEQTHPFLIFLESLVNLISTHFLVDKQQVYLGLLLSSLLVIVSLCTHITWQYYSPIIADFSLKEEIEKTRKQQVEKEKVAKMDAFKSFLKKKKVDKHFKKSGEGQRLTDESSSSSKPSIVSGSSQGGSVDRVAAADVAAQAALKRILKDDKPQLTTTQKNIQLIAQRELEEERRRSDPAYRMKELGLEPAPAQIEVREFDFSPAISGVYFTCDFLGDNVARTKAELFDELESYLETQLETEDGIISAIFMVYSLNHKQIKDTCIDTIGKYVSNILEHSDDPKYRKIKMSNRAFQERIAACRGGMAFLKTIGFEEKQEAPEGDAEPEKFLVMSEGRAQDIGDLVNSLEALRNGQSVPIKIHRNLKIYKVDPSKRLQTPKLPLDFFDLSPEELKREQRLREEETKKLTSLRTQEMRSKDVLRQYKYKYTLIRVKTPDHFVIEGTFGVYESLDAVRQFVCPTLSSETMTFQFKDPVTNKVLGAEDKSLNDLGLAPAAIIHMILSDSLPGPSLKEEHIAEAEML